jgi:hypothetical protein
MEFWGLSVWNETTVREKAIVTIQLDLSMPKVGLQSSDSSRDLTIPLFCSRFLRIEWQSLASKVEVGRSL